MNNLRQIDGAKQQWALENGKGSTATPADTDIQPYMGRGTSGALPLCPLDTTQTWATSYTAGDMSTAPVCKIAASTHKLP
jgi:hypothetical protein